MKIISYCDLIIKYSFYSLFFFVPLVFLSSTSELFEFNKMWLTFGLTTIIGAAWISKMIIKKKLIIKRTPLDIPLILFLISQIISTIFSLDTHVSLWGYYSRFNGGLLSIISYIFLYYAFISNLEIKHVMRVIFISLTSGLITAIWGFPSHFGYDPTCLLFRGSLDTNCWTDAFKPTVRVFSTLGQPAWFAAYLNVLLPLSIAYFIIKAKNKINMRTTYYILLATLFYVSLIFANTRAGIIAFYSVDIIFWIILFYKKIFKFKTLLKNFLIIHIIFTVCTFFYGVPLNIINKFTYPQLKKNIIAHAQVPTKNTVKPQTKSSGITDSGEIRLYVWRGAVNAWKANPIFGSGVETFAFAYYKHRPSEHNLTSEWDYLYNKAHNEYLNYLTTTGIVGLGTYLIIIFTFLFLTSKYIYSYKKSTISNQPSTINNQQSTINHQHLILIIALLSAYISILITNFFGFSVVIINLYLFLIPAFAFIIFGHQNKKDEKIKHLNINSFQWILIIITILISLVIIYRLFLYWYADTKYALGNNLDKVSSFQQAYPLLDNAVKIEPNEPVYKDEFAVNLATLANAYYLQNDTATASLLAEKAIKLDDEVIQKHPNNLIFWKNRLRIFYALGTSDTQNEEIYLQEALRILKIAHELAPTDPKVSFNLGMLLGQTGNLKQGAEMLKKTIKLKPNYVEAYYALGLYYHQLAIGLTTATATPSAQEVVKDQQMQQKAIEIYQYILDNLSPDDTSIKNALKTWKGEK